MTDRGRLRRRWGTVPATRNLLDWLAVEFVESGWDVNHMLLSLMLTSATYQQSSRVDPSLAEKQ